MAHKYLNYLYFLLLPFIGGVFYAAGFPSKILPTFFLLPIIGFCFFLHPVMSKNISFRRELATWFFYSLGLAFAGFYWIPYTIGEFGNIPFPANYIIGLCYSLIALPHLLLFIIAKRLITNFSLPTFFLFSNLSTRNITLAFIFTLLEYYTPQLFPAHLGHPWIQLAPYLGVAPILGSPVFSFFAFWIALAAVKFASTRKLDIGLAISLPLFIVANLIIPLPSKNLKGPTILTNIRIVQPNIGNFLKISSESGKGSASQKVYKRYLKLSGQKTKKDLDLIIWPETAFPHLLNSALMRVSSGYVPILFKKVIEKTNTMLFTGGYDKASNENSGFFETEYNSVFLFNKDGSLSKTYDKQLLIPFGESLPFGPFNKYLYKFVQNISYFATGERFSLFELKNNTTFIAAICYEILFPRFIQSYLNSTGQQANFLINVTNDSWYGDTSEPLQHLALSKWRAIEFNIPIIRATNTGITSVLYPDGSESKRLGVYTQNILDVELNLKQREKTIFQIIGFGGIVILWIILLLAFYFLPSRLAKD